MVRCFSLLILNQYLRHTVGCDALNTTLEAILGCYALNLGRSWWTVASCLFACATFYLTTWEEYHTGQLYLGVFSGPVEGILMIVGIYFMTGLYGVSPIRIFHSRELAESCFHFSLFTGPAFWDKGILTFLHLEHTKVASVVPNAPLNVTFMYFSALGLFFNIITSIANVRAHIQPAHPPTPPDTPSSSSYPSSSPIYPASEPIPSRTQRFKPLLRIIPFPLSALLHLSLLAHPSPLTSTILHSSLFVPFLCAWGLQFAHQVGRMILAHLTQRRDMPFFERLWVPTLLATLDLNSEFLFGR